MILFGAGSGGQARLGCAYREKQFDRANIL
jgi:hypothetical protein